MENYIRFLFILLMCSNSYCDECITYDFEEGFDEMFSYESGVCKDFLNPWTKNNYSSLGLESPHPSSTTFISPTGYLSCVSSFMFNATKGILDVKVYTKSWGNDFYFLILVYESLGGLIGSHTFRDLMEGWHNLRLPILNDLELDVNVTFSGRKDSIFIDSFRYIPSTMDEEDCVIYDNTTPSTPTVGSTTDLSTKSPTYFERCIKFNFENHYDTTFSSGSGFCTGANPWTLSNFTLLEMNCFHPLSTSLIAPKSTFSCITSPNFLMGDGTLEFNVYMGNVSRSNFPLFWMINILVQVKSDDGTDKTIATTSYNSHSDNFVPGWNTLKIDVQNLRQEGHVVLMGIKTEGSIVFMDSFRFIPSTMNDDMCILYENQITIDDSEITKITVTEAWETESNTPEPERDETVTD